MQTTKILKNMHPLSLVTGILSGIVAMVYLFTYNHLTEDSLMQLAIFSSSVLLVSTIFGFGLSVLTHFLTNNPK